MGKKAKRIARGALTLGTSELVRAGRKSMDSFKPDMPDIHLPDESKPASIDEQGAAAAARERERLRRTRGRGSTILTSPLGDVSSANVGRSTLLGG